MGALLKAEFIVPDRKRELFGFLPKMATHSKASLGLTSAVMSVTVQFGAW